MFPQLSSRPLSRILATSLLGVGFSLQIPLTASKQCTDDCGPPLQNHSLIHGAVASESRQCSEIGIELLRAGGNAVDAVIGTTLCVGVIGMYHSGLGGGGFALVRTPNGEAFQVDFRETAPAAAHENMYDGNVMGSIVGGLAAGVPGEVRGFEELHRRWGKLPWDLIFEPATKLARDGFVIGADLETVINTTIKADGSSFLRDNPIWAQEFAPNGTLLRMGMKMSRPRLAATLEKIGREGSDAFYRGEVAASLINAIRQTNGTMTLKDLEDYQPVVKPATNVTYRDKILFACSAPSSGAIGLSMLKTMEQYPLEDWDNNVNLTWHRFDEAMRFAYAARSRFGDPDFLPNVTILENMLISSDMAKRRHELIDDKESKPVDYYLNNTFSYLPETHGTSHIVTTDSSGLTVTLTTTINLYFGARLMDPVSGVILNDEMNDFSIPNVNNQFGYPPSPENFIRPGKRPLSSITPIIAAHKNGTFYFATGAAGGSRILSSTTQVAWHIIEHGDSLSRALARPRLHDQLVPNTAVVETGFDAGITAFLMAKGHNVTESRLAGSSVQAVGFMSRGRRGQGMFVAAGEPRQKDSGGLTV